MQEREILFRGKRVDTGEWVCGYYISMGGGKRHFIMTGKFDLMKNPIDLESYEIDPKTLGRYTGLTDKNGKKIFEGDIVKTKYGRLSVVVWFSSPSHNGWDLEIIRTNENILRTKMPNSFDLYEKNNLEVIGNIHDNPELWRINNDRIQRA